MTRERIAEGVLAVTDPAVNWALVEDGGRVTAIDAGLPSHWDELLAGLADLGRGLGDLEAVVLTHAHIDHMGWAERARTEAGARVFVHEADRDNLRLTSVAASERSPLRYLTYPATRELMATMLRARAFGAKPIREATTYRDGDTLDVPGHPRAVHAPGHTWGECALHLADRGVLFAGDAFVTHDPYTGRTGPCVVARAATANSAQNLRSLDALAGIDADVVLTGHGEPWLGGVGEAVRRAQAAGPA
jgi:glyoxylase-like metal-dependent hydrolase (beta-lactamase superfamily II)